MKTTEKTYVADVTTDQFFAVQRRARKLRSDAFRDAGRAVAAWFRGRAAKATDAASAPQDGRTA